MQIFSPICSLSFHLVNVVFCKAKVFNFYDNNLSIFHLMEFAFGVKSKNSLPSTTFEDFLLCFSLYILHFSL